MSLRKAAQWEQRVNDFIQKLIMSENLNNHESWTSLRKRRNFLKYMAGGAIASIGIGYLFPQRSQSQEDLDNLCSKFPSNSRCENFLPGVRATDETEQPIQADKLLASVKPGDRIPVRGLIRPKVAYLVINEKPEIDQYAISSICTHFGCTVQWDAESNKFNCPCHGSQFDSQGRVVRGPAKRPLAQISVFVKQNQVRLVNRKLEHEDR